MAEKAISYDRVFFVKLLQHTVVTSDLGPFHYTSLYFLRLAISGTTLIFKPRPWFAWQGLLNPAHALHGGVSYFHFVCVCVCVCGQDTSKSI